MKVKLPTLAESAALLVCKAATGTVLQPFEVRVNGEW